MGRWSRAWRMLRDRRARVFVPDVRPSSGAPRWAARSFDGATTGRRGSGWGATSTGPNAEIASGIVALRDRSRELVRNNAHGERIVSLLASSLVGSGIRPQVTAATTAEATMVEELWAEWAKRCDSEMGLDVYGQQTLMVRSMAEGGEALVRRRPRRLSDGLPVPLQLQLLEGDLLDSGKMETGRLSGRPQLAGARIVQGVEFDALNRRAAYWLFREHPGENILPFQGSSIESVRVPAGEIAHLYEPRRIGQVRGIPWLSPVMLGLRDLGDYTDAAVVNARENAAFCGVIIPAIDTAGDEPIGLALDADGQIAHTAAVDSNGKITQEVQPGMWAVARNGKDIRFNTPSPPHNYPEFQRTNLHRVAAGARMTYELLSGDLSQVNYSSIRAGLLEYRRGMDALRAQIVIQKFCEPVWSWFLGSAQAAGKLPMFEADGSPVRYAVTWQPPRWEEVDRLKEAMADLVQLRTGSISLREVAARNGHTDVGALLQEIADVWEIGEDLGLVFDSNPGQVTKSGIAQAVEGTALDAAAGTEAA